VSYLESPLSLLLIGFAASLFWRALGAVLAGRIEVDTPIFDWCVCVTQALVCGLMMRAIFIPTNALAEVPATDRVAASLVGLTVFLISRWNVMAGVSSGVIVLAAAVLGRAG
jgi:hypothetical protein